MPDDEDAPEGSSRVLTYLLLVVMAAALVYWFVAKPTTRGDLKEQLDRIERRIEECACEPSGRASRPAQ